MIGAYRGAERFLPPENVYVYTWVCFYLDTIFPQTYKPVIVDKTQLHKGQMNGDSPGQAISDWDAAQRHTAELAHKELGSGSKRGPAAYALLPGRAWFAGLAAGLVVGLVIGRSR